MLSAIACAGSPAPVTLSVKRASVVITAGSSVQLEATARGGVFWSLGAGSMGSVSADGLYNCERNAPGLTGSAVANVTALLDPSQSKSVLIILAPATVSAPETVTAGLSYAALVPSLPGVTYTWSMTHATLADGQSTNQIHFVVDAALNSNIQLFCQITDATGGFVVAEARPAVVQPPPAVSIQASGMYISENGRGSAAVPQPPSGVEYVWQIENGTIIGGQGTSSISFIAGKAGPLVLKLTLDNHAGGTSSGSLQISVVPLPPNVRIQTQKFVLAGTPGATATTTADQPASWIASAGTTISSDATGRFVTYTPAAAGWLTLGTTMTNLAGDTSRAEARVTVSASGLQTLAGRNGGRGFVDGPIENARFLSLAGAVYSIVDRTLYIADGTALRQFGPNGVSTMAGGPSPSGPSSAECTGQTTSAIVPALSGIARDDAGTLYISGADGKICAVNAYGQPKLFATVAGGIDGLTYGQGKLVAVRQGLATVFAADGTVAQQLGIAGSLTTNGMMPVAVGPDGHVYVGGLKGPVTNQTAVVEDLTTGIDVLSAPAADPQGALSSPASLLFEQSGNLLIADQGTNQISRWNGSTLTPVAGTRGAPGLLDGPASQSRFNSFAGLAETEMGNIYVLDALDGVVRVVSGSSVSTVLGIPPPSSTPKDGPGIDAILATPLSVVVAADGTVYAADEDGSIVRVTAQGVVQTFAHVPQPTHIGLGPGGSVLVSCADATIRAIDAKGSVSVFAGTGTAGYSDGPTNTAQLGAFDISWPKARRFVNGGALAWDGTDTLYVADTANQRVRTVKNGQVSTFLSGVVVEGVAVSQGKIYVLRDGARVERYASTAALENSFMFPAGTVILNGGIAVDGFGVVYVDDPRNQRVWKVDFGAPTPAAQVFAGNANQVALLPGPLPAALYWPVGLAVAPDGAPNAGVLFIADAAENSIAMARP